MNIIRSFLAPSSWMILVAASTISMCYIVGLAVYRLFFHPLAKYPGPRLAALTQLYEFYHDVIRPGQYTWVIKSMHERYGPIVRINPFQLHVDDPEFYDELYTSANNPRDKWSFEINMFDRPGSVFTTIESDLHRTRRAPLNPFFSKRSVVQLTPAITKHLEKFCKRIEEWRGSEQSLGLRGAYAALTLDVVTDYSFADPNGSLDHPEFDPQWLEAIDSSLELTYLNAYFPCFPALMKQLPIWVVKFASPAMLKVIEWQLHLQEQIVAIMNDPGDKKYKTSGHPTIFHKLLDSSNVSASDQNLERFMNEAQSIVAAGLVTTAYHLNVTSYHVLANPSILSTLKAELEMAMPDPSILPPLEKLENLPYLNAVVQEGHRITHGVVHRAARVSHKPIIYREWTIPPETPVSMSAIFMHENREIFPLPHTFDPTRWLGEDGARRRKYLVPFSKGTRSCLGQTLGNAELFFTLAAVFRRFDFRIYETQREDIDVAYDYVTPMPRKGSKGLRVLVE